MEVEPAGLAEWLEAEDRRLELPQSTATSVIRQRLSQQYTVHCYKCHTTTVVTTIHSPLLQVSHDNGCHNNTQSTATSVTRQRLS